MKKHLYILIGLFFLLMLTHGMSEAAYDCNACHTGHAGSMPSFHNADQLICSKCHTIHYSEDNALPADAEAGGPFSQLLLKSSTTDVCLICHQGPLNSNSTGAPRVLTDDGSMGTNYPSLSGGDFYYSKTDQRKGHNPGGSVGTDSILTQSPGGTFTSADESCVSCHDPHGGSPANTYRLLKKKPAGWTGADLIVTGDEGHPGGDEEADPPAYNTGFGAWCGACHSGFHGSDVTDSDVGDGTDWIRHPVDAPLGTEIAGNYGATPAWLYPVQDVDSNGSVSSTDQVFCLSCHRSHGTPYLSGTRWDSAQPSGAGAGCNKCHAKGS